MRILWTGLLLAAALAALAWADEKPTPELAVGETAPAFRLNDQEGRAVSLEDARRDAWVVLAFFPKADTPG
jgi:cytochrome oxidase Cu insertion factor (SCO1/SenC/PrrC family)